MNERKPGIELPNPDYLTDVARALNAIRTEPRLAWWRGDYYEHTGTHYAVKSDAEVRGWIYSMTESAFFATKEKDGDKFKDVKKRYRTGPKFVNGVGDALSHLVLQRIGEPEAGMAFTNGFKVSAEDELLPHSPDRFNLNALDFAYDPDAECPMFLDFLETIHGNDEDGKAGLQEWFGYVLSGRTDLEKMALLIGPRRCGKGTLATILEAMVGATNWTAPTLRSLGTQFGRQCLIGKSLAVMGDVKWTKRLLADVQEDLLGLTGRDGVTIQRKNRVDWEGHLDVRLMAMSNHVPVFDDASAALGGRFVYFTFEKSFFGNEDITLKERLLTELPGIFNWAMEGLKRLDKQLGQFTQSAAAQELRNEVDRDANPVGAFREDCMVYAEGSYSMDAVLTQFRHWAKEARPALANMDMPWFSRHLRTATSGHEVVISRTMVAGKRTQTVTGLQWIPGALIDPLHD